MLILKILHWCLIAFAIFVIVITIHVYKERWPRDRVELTWISVPLTLLLLTIALFTLNWVWLCVAIAEAALFFVVGRRRFREFNQYLIDLRKSIEEFRGVPLTDEEFLQRMQLDYYESRRLAMKEHRTGVMATSAEVEELFRETRTTK